MDAFESAGCNGNVRALEQRDFFLRWARRAGYVAAAGVLACGAFFGYGAWRTRHLEKQAQQFLAQHDAPSAVLVARRLLTMDVSNVVACRVMAELADAAGATEAVSWRQQVVANEPPNTDDDLALVGTAMRFGHRALAANVLERLPAGARTTVRYHELAGALALAEKQPANAATHFAAAVALRPDDLHLQLNLAIVQLSSTDPTIITQARADLARLVEPPDTRLEALRALAADAVQNDRSRARKWTGLLITQKNPTFADRLHYLEAVLGSDDAPGALSELQSTAQSWPAAAAALIAWMNRHDMARAAVDWSSTLPQSVTRTQPVPLAIAESYSCARDWPKLRAFVAGKNWGDNECMRLAIESHSSRHLSPTGSDSMEAQTLWRAALKSTQNHSNQLAALAELAEGWGYKSEAEDAWWMIANGTENTHGALLALYRLYKIELNSRGLLRVAKRALELNPGDLVAANNCASLGLLLTGDSSARRLAVKLHAEYPTNVAFAVTYAYGLQSEGKAGDAVKVLQKLSDEQLHVPAIAAYYVVALVENNEFDRARTFLPFARKAELLPEEEQLLGVAARKLFAAEPSSSVANLAHS